MTKSAEKRRGYQGPALFSFGFRPFFLGAAVYAALALALWMAMLTGQLELPSHLAPRDWHVHEMLFGYLGAVMAGFLLTAIPNWTGRLPLFGRGLMILFGLWLAGRLVVLVSRDFGATALVVEAAFLFVLTAVAGREILSGRNWRNLPVCLLLALFALSNLVFHLESHFLFGTSYGERGGLAVAVMLIALIGGRIVPSFTRNWLAKRGATRLPAAFSPFDRVALAVLGLSLPLWVALPETAAAAAALLTAGLLQAARLARWRGTATFAEPLVAVLHLAYLWLPLGLILTGAAALGSDWPDRSSGLHALTAGAIGTMTLAVMTRASLGHGGRPLRADGATVAIYACVLLGALGRVVAYALPLDPWPLLLGGALLWGGAFVLFALAYGPLLARSRPTGA